MLVMTTLTLLAMLCALYHLFALQKSLADHRAELPQIIQDAIYQELMVRDYEEATNQQEER